MMTLAEQWVQHRIDTSSKQSFLNWYNEFIWPQERNDKTANR